MRRVNSGRWRLAKVALLAGRAPLATRQDRTQILMIS